MVTRGLGALVRVASRAGLVLLLGGWGAISGAAQTPFSGAQTPEPETLEAVLETLDWEPGARGALLILDPKLVRRAEILEEQPTGGRSFRRAVAPTPKKGVYRLNQWEEYFGRRVVSMGTMSVFAPAMMTTLVYRNLPKPDPYAGMADSAKMALLASGLSPPQWRALGGPDGIGMNDLSGKQRDLFASLLPEPLRVHSYTIDAEGAYTSHLEPTTLTPQQRLNVRLRAVRKMDWTFDMENNGVAGIGVSEQPTPGTAILQQIPTGDNWEAQRKQIFGVKLLPESPNRLKPGDLDFAAPALAPAISLTDAKTIGDLVTRAAEATGVEVYCDVRYADLPVYLRGDAARAGDVLKAICYAIFGTFRKVGPAFILTDDRVGLGTRHLILGEWAAQNRILGEQRVKEMQQAAARANPAQYIGWDGGDPETLDPALKGKIENYLRSVNAPPTEAERKTGQTERLLRVPVTELPAWAQERVKRQVESIREQNELSPEQEQFFRIKTDHVRMDVSTRLRFVVPGLGQMDAQLTSGGMGGGGADLIQLARAARTIAPEQTAPPEVLEAKNIKIPALASRALLIRPETKDDIEKAAAAAKARGLNELWADVPPGAPELVEAAVAAGKTKGLKVVAVIRVLRPGKSVAAPFDLNLMGQTSTARADSAPLWSSPFVPWRMEWDKEADRMRRRALGDWLRPDLPATRDALRPLLIRLAKIPGLAGMVLRDYQPPGYDKTATPQYSSREITDTEALGYGEEMRLAFLRRYQVDPVDLSPLPGGKLGGWNAPAGQEYIFTEFALPYFPDYGPDGMGWNVNGSPGTTIGARDRWGLWNQFRVKTADAFLRQLGAELTVAAPEIALLRMVGPDEPKQYVARYVSPLPAAPNPAAKETPKATREGDASKKADGEPPVAEASLSALDKARRDGKPALACLSYYRSQDNDRRRAFAQQMQLQINMTWEWNLWDGIVLDLSSVPVAAALPLLDIVVVEPTSTATKASKPK